MSDFMLVDGVYPNGQKYQEVSITGIRIGHLIESSAGFSERNWRKPVADKNAALEKMRVAAIKERKRQIAKLAAEIEKLVAI